VPGASCEGNTEDTADDIRRDHMLAANPVPLPGVPIRGTCTEREQKEHWPHPWKDKSTSDARVDQPATSCWSAPKRRHWRLHQTRECLGFIRRRRPACPAKSTLSKTFPAS